MIRSRLNVMQYKVYTSVVIPACVCVCVVLVWTQTVTRDGSVRLTVRTHRAAVSCQWGFVRVLGALASAGPRASSDTHKHTHILHIPISCDYRDCFVLLVSQYYFYIDYLSSSVVHAVYQKNVLFSAW